MQQKEKIVSKSFVLLFLISICVCTAMNMLNVTIPLLVTEDLGGSTATSGFLATIYTVAACLSRPINGVLTDRFGRRAMICIGAALFGLSCLFCGWAGGLAVVFLLRALMGIGYSAASTADNTASTDVIPASRMSEGIGYFGISQSISSAIGPAIAAFAISLVGNRGSMTGTAVLCFAAFALALPVTYEKKEKPTGSAAKKAGFVFEKTAILPSVFQGFSLLFISCLMCFMTLYIVGKGFSSTVAGTFFLISSLSIVVVRLLGSRFVDRVDRRCLLIPSYLLLLVTFLLVTKANSPLAFWALGILYGIGHGTIWMTLGSEAVRKAAPAQRGAANATFYFAFDASIGIGASLWGVLIDAIGFAYAFCIAGVGFVLLALAAFRFFRPEH